MSETSCLPPFCPMSCGRCGLSASVAKDRLSLKPYAFVALPYDGRFDDSMDAIRIALEGGDLIGQKFYPKHINGNYLKAVDARIERFVGNGTCKICQLCWFSDFGVAELATLNPNVLAEIGLLWGFGKPVVFILHIGYTDSHNIPFDLRNFLFVPYQSIQKLGLDLEDKIRFVLSIL